MAPNSFALPAAILKGSPMLKEVKSAVVVGVGAAINV